MPQISRNVHRACLAALVLSAGCSGDARARVAARDVPRDTTAPHGTHVTESGGNVDTLRPDTGDYPVLRGLYLNRWAAQSASKLRHLLDIADATEINAFVIDMKDEFGLNFRSANPEWRRNAGTGHGLVPDVKALVDSVKAHGVVPIARIVTFKDPVAATVHPDWTIRREDGSIWQDKEGLAWVNAYDPRVQEYNLQIAEELARLGFEEIQWDYVRFPEPYQSLPKQVFPGATTSKSEALAAFLKKADVRLDSLGVRNTADVFGLVTSVRGTLEVGQNWEALAPVTDVMLPMVYPSHYPRGAFGIEVPNAEPYRVVLNALKPTSERDEALGITRAEHVRPWLQAFTLGRMEYGPEELRAQKQAVYDAGYRGWVLWSPGSHYDAFVPALEESGGAAAAQPAAAQPTAPRPEPVSVPRGR